VNSWHITLLVIENIRHEGVLVSLTGVCHPTTIIDISMANCTHFPCHLLSIVHRHMDDIGRTSSQVFCQMYIYSIHFKQLSHTILADGNTLHILSLDLL